MTRLFSPSSWDIRDSRSFQSLKSLVLAALCGQEVTDEREISRLIPLNPPDLRNNHHLILRLELYVIELLREQSLVDQGSLQFPINIRVMRSGVSTRRHPDRESYSTELLHCDAWSGAPSDSRNHLIYLYTELDCPYLEMYESLDKSDPLRSFVGSYEELPDRLFDRKKISIPCESGIMAVWPTYSPHRTVVPAAGTSRAENSPLRISIDFRTRESSPYEEDRNSTMDTFSDSKMNSLGVYWSFPTGATSMEDKIQVELSIARAHGPKAYARRQEYIRKYYPDAAVFGL